MKQDVTEPLWESCADCMQHYYETPFLVESFNSVGIEHGKSAYQMAESYFKLFHEKKHPTADDFGSAADDAQGDGA